MIDLKKYNLEGVDKQLGNTFWSPVDVAYINDWVLRAAAVKGEIVIEIEGGKPINLKKDEGVVIPAGVRHKPRAAERAVVLLLEPKSLNTKGENR